LVSGFFACVSLASLLATRRMLIAAFIVCISLVTSQAIAGQLEDGKAAYNHWDFATALRLLRPLAESGNAEAEYYLGWMYLNERGVPQNFTEAAKWFRKAADQNYASAQTELGLRYEGGQGVPRDIREAIKWWRKAASQDYEEAQYYLGRQYEHGEGVPQDFVMAHMWYNLTASHGDEPNDSTTEGWESFARTARDRVAAKMTPSQLELAQRLAREWKPMTEH